MSEQSIGFIGVGRMGGRLARRLIDAGYSLTIFDTSEAAVRAVCRTGRASGELRRGGCFGVRDCHHVFADAADCAEGRARTGRRHRRDSR